jgi:hypothetical protein
MDTRENILSRLAELCAAVTGVATVVRNRLDVRDLDRPLIVILDGSERMADPIDYGRDIWRADAQINELLPALAIHVRGSDSVDGGGLLSLYRTRVLAAVLNDSTMSSYVSRINYGGAEVATPTAEGQEYRMDLTLAFHYRFRREDMT